MAYEAEKLLLVGLRRLIEEKDSTLEEIRDTLAKIGEKNRAEWYDWSPLVAAVEQRRLDVLKLLVQEGFSVNSTVEGHEGGAYNWCALGAAVGQKDVATSKMLIKEYKAVPDVSRLYESQTLLSTAIVENDFQIVNLLLADLGADVDKGVTSNPNCDFSVRQTDEDDNDDGDDGDDYNEDDDKVEDDDDSEDHIHPIYLAISIDIYKAAAQWPMTKLILSFGASLSSICNWSVQHGQVVLGCPLNNGNVSEFVEDLTMNLHHKLMEKERLEYLQDLIATERALKSFYGAFNSDNKISLSKLSKLDASKTFWRSPLVLAAQKGRQDLVHVVGKVLGFDVNKPEELSGMSPLAAAVKSGNKSMVKYLVKSLGAEVDQRLQLVGVLEPVVECSIAMIAVKNQDLEMLRLLCQDLGARVDDCVEIDGEETTLVHLALELAAETVESDVFDELVRLGADLNCPGCYSVNGVKRYGPPIELAFGYKSGTSQYDFWSHVIEKIGFEEMKSEANKMKSFEVKDLAANLKDEALKFKYRQSLLKKKLDIGVKSLEQAKANSNKIADLKTDDNYLTEQGIKEAMLEVKRKAKSASDINKNITKIVGDSNYRTANELKALTEKAAKETAACISCSKTFPQTKIWKCRMSHIRCMACYPNTPAQCVNCQTTIGVVPMSKPALALEIEAAEELLEKLEALQSSPDLMTSEEIAAFEAEQWEKIRRANLLNEQIGVLMKFGGTEDVAKLEEAVMYLSEALGESKPDDNAEPESKKECLMSSASGAVTPTAESQADGDTIDALIRQLMAAKNACNNSKS